MTAKTSPGTGDLDLSPKISYIDLYPLLYNSIVWTVGKGGDCIKVGVLLRNCCHAKGGFVCVRSQ